MKKLLRIKAVMEITGLSRTVLYRLMDDGEFPKSIQLSPRAVAWDSDAVQDWIKAKLKAAA
ncbi:MAG: AlpA family transcriptional regulator [gamma proteobacterium symbiont of Bathyaustriella thionipta]|nr:AlpA family transcriptional regulator [gamma proteobacterium symbiont of Bathyaustriella thionipta]